MTKTDEKSGAKRSESCSLHRITTDSPSSSTGKQTFFITHQHFVSVRDSQSFLESKYEGAVPLAPNEGIVHVFKGAPFMGLLVFYRKAALREPMRRTEGRQQFFSLYFPFPP